jgi:hypothetical protein
MADGESLSEAGTYPDREFFMRDLDREMRVIGSNRCYVKPLKC